MTYQTSKHTQMHTCTHMNILTNVHTDNYTIENALTHSHHSPIIHLCETVSCQTHITIVPRQVLGFLFGIRVQHGEPFGRLDVRAQCEHLSGLLGDQQMVA